MIIILKRSKSQVLPAERACFVEGVSLYPVFNALSVEFVTATCMLSFSLLGVVADNTLDSIWLIIFLRFVDCLASEPISLRLSFTISFARSFLRANSFVVQIMGLLFSEFVDYFAHA